MKRSLQVLILILALVVALPVDRALGTEMLQTPPSTDITSEEVLPPAEHKPDQAPVRRRRPSPRKALVLHLDFNAQQVAPGATVPNRAGKVTGTLMGTPEPIRGIGKGSHALRFDGIGDGIRVPACDAIQPEVLTIAVWVRYAAPPDDDEYHCFFWKRNFNTICGEDYAMGFRRTGRIDICAADAFQHQTRGDSHTLFTPGSWHHLVGTYSPTNIRLYVDGKLDLDLPSRSPLVHNPSADLLIGVADNGHYFGWNAFDLDDFRLYAAELTPCQVRKLYREKAAAAQECPIQVQHAAPPPVVTTYPPRRPRSTSPAPSTTLEADLELIIRFGRENGYATPAYLDLLESTLSRHRSVKSKP